MIYFVTRYDSKTRQPAMQAVDADSKTEAAEKVSGFKVVVAPIESATVSVVAIGEKPSDQQYYREE